MGKTRVQANGKTAAGAAKREEVARLVARERELAGLIAEKVDALLELESIDKMMEDERSAYSAALTKDKERAEALLQAKLRKRKKRGSRKKGKHRRHTHTGRQEDEDGEGKQEETQGGGEKEAVGGWVLEEA